MKLLSQLEKSGVIEQRSPEDYGAGDTLQPEGFVSSLGNSLNVEELPVVLRDRIRTLCDNSSGVIQTIERVDIEPSEPSFACFAAIGFTNLHSSPHRFVAKGKGLDDVEALRSVLGESVERYCAGVYREANLLRATSRDIQAGALDPRLLVDFTAEQASEKGFPYVRFTEDREHYWVLARCLTGSRDVFVPAEFVFVPFTPAGGEPLLWRANTSGIAAGPTREFSLLHALLEVLERDALMVSWYGRAARHRIDISEVGDCRVTEVVGRIRRCGLDVWCFDLTTDINVPTCLSLIIDFRSRKPLVTAGCAANNCWRTAVYKGLIECLQIRTSLRRRGKTGHDLEGPHDVRSIRDHAFYYYDHVDRLDAFSFLFNCDAIKLGELERRVEDWSIDAPLKECKRRIQSAGYDIYWVDMTPVEVQELGYYVSRVLIPGLVPLHFGHDAVPLELPRLKRIRLEGKAVPGQWPHPLA